MERTEAMQLFQSTGIYAITAECLSAGRSNLEVVQAMLSGGIRFLQYREKAKPARVMYEECRAIRSLCRQYRAAFIVDDFVDLALAVDADGVHIGQDDLPVPVVRRLIGERRVLGLSTHNPPQLEAGNAWGAAVDYLGVGPVFPTKTKENPAPVTGLEYVRYAAHQSAKPFVAIGGIKMSNICSVAASGAATLALVSEITGAVDIPERIAALRQQLGQSYAGI